MLGQDGVVLSYMPGYCSLMSRYRGQLLLRIDHGVTAMPCQALMNKGIRKPYTATLTL
jgi:hypothetical protein